MDSIKRFLSIDSGYGYGYGSDYGDGDGYGYGYGDGYGSGYGDGDGSGYGDGSGHGSDYGYGDGSGYGDGLKAYNNQRIDDIDGIGTIITKVKGNIAKGFTVGSDLKLTPCFVVKQDNIFAHGKTLKEAQLSLMDKLFEDMPEEERIDMFLSEFSLGKKYPSQEFFDWHGKLTGSCVFGREQFAKDKNIDLTKDKFTVQEFLDMTKNSYGSEVICNILAKL